MEKENTIRVNRLPAITWHTLKINDATLSVPDRFTAPTCTMEGNLASSPVEFKEIRSGSGEAFDSLLSGTAVQTYDVVSTDNAEVPVRFHFAPVSDAAEAAVLRLVAKKNENLTVITDITGEEHASLYLQILLDIDQGATVKLVQVQAMPSSSILVNAVGGTVGENGNVELVQLLLGGEKTYASSRISLSGNESKLNASLAYLGEKDSLTDLNYHAVHEGKRTESSFETYGVLRDNSRKTYRGTIDFLRGSSGSVGTEYEDVLLLGEDVRNKSIPLILCAEEDVQGAHGASIGQLDDDMLFYLGSRGIDPKTAEKLMAKAKLDTVAHRIGDEKAEEMAETTIEGQF